MPAGRRRPWLVCYDITDPKRLRRVHRYLSQRAIPIQYSVFLAHVTSKGIREILSGVEARIDSRRDDVRCYPLMANAEPYYFGRKALPDDVQLVHAEPDAVTP